MSDDVILGFVFVVMWPVLFVGMLAVARFMTSDLGDRFYDRFLR